MEPETSMPVARDNPPKLESDLALVMGTGGVNLGRHNN